MLKITTKDEVQLEYNEYITNISSEMNLKFGEYWEISEKDLLKFCQKLENLSKNFGVKIELLFIGKDLQCKFHLLSICFDSNTLEL